MAVIPKRLPLREVNTLLAEKTRISMEKRRQIADMWRQGYTKVADYQRQTKIAEKTAYKVVNMLKKAEEDYVLQQSGGTVGIGEPAQHDPDHEDFVGDDNEKDVLTDQRIMDILDKNIQISSDAGETRNVKDLISVRNAIVPIREGLPKTKIDIERTLGRKGILGMDDQLVATISRFLTHRAEYPKTWTFLCNTFAFNPENDPLLPTDEDVSRETYEAAP